LLAERDQLRGLGLNVQFPGNSAIHHDGNRARIDRHRRVTGYQSGAAAFGRKSMHSTLVENAGLPASLDSGGGVIGGLILDALAILMYLWSLRRRRSARTARVCTQRTQAL
jgi:hypothetical protein